MRGCRNALLDDLRLALDTLRNHKFRSFLTVLSVLVGIATVIVVASAFAGLDQQFAEAARDFGTRTLFIFKFQVGMKFTLSREERLRKPLAYEDAVAIREECPAVERVAVEKYLWSMGPPSLRYKGGEVRNYTFLGATIDDFAVVNDNLGDGRFFTDIDNLHRRQVAVIGSDIVKRLFAGQDPIGKVLRIGNSSFEVVGTILARKSFPGDTGSDRVVKIPYLTFRKMYPDEKENFIIAAAYEGKLDQAIDEITALLRYRRRDKPSAADSFGIVSSEALVGRFRALMGTVILVTMLISSIGLLVGGIGVMNIMLVSVTERTREIGLRKAVGARPRDIMWQFLLEAVAVTGAGGLMGILAGFLLSLAVRLIVPSLRTSVPAWSVLAGLIIAVSVGLFFGTYPAVKASRLNPITALRHE
jgi:ABC-type antimicrobial peptide transport system permease subunit